MVGPGIMPIPNDGWGAVEIVVWQQKLHLESAGHHVNILNKRGLSSALLARPWSYDLVHLHYDELASFWIRLCSYLRVPLLITTHYGYAASPEKWEADYYHEIFKAMMSSPGMLVLNSRIEKTFQQRGYAGWLGVLPNGTDVSNIRFGPVGNRRAICLGKIEKRKRQAELTAMLNASQSVQCDFVGPIADNDFEPDGKSTRYLGVWTRHQVCSRLTEYSCLVLASAGEAHPLVVLEALAAGLSVVVTEEAGENLASREFIYVQEFSVELCQTLATACRDNSKFRLEAREYAKESFDWSVVASAYASQVTQFLKLRSNGRDNRCLEYKL
jgi:glycosyltransferase involved in cell wall biosynthesis